MFRRLVGIVPLVLLLSCTGITPLMREKTAPESRVARKIENALKRIDENPDVLHSEHTPATHELIVIGEPALEPTLPYLNSENPFTREHAETVVWGVLRVMHGYERGKGWKSDADKAAFDRFASQMWGIDANGDMNVLDALSETERRSALIERLKGWLQSRK